MRKEEKESEKKTKLFSQLVAQPHNFLNQGVTSKEGTILHALNFPDKCLQSSTSKNHYISRELASPLDKGKDKQLDQ